ncbi:MAG: hypothetical protein CO183_01705 [Candidatus Zambryskibacteria bacterium CG_4_9_14_3_um_filter_42_9]|uniref:Nudix hydrolase domain-containing protein n=1 Tax=Candidatus Zambryskibacteria bacterium CG22_combo_CG10-13_8_21_14_all_42_17 TaxID=1975118 RepID=A0A2H0BDX2_9BACT|nr:MAG: hypothetical protein COX06_00885 [Candidatus Zambryskibacteria bacterium CG22_combo_CG10-13_8_21_14_all_42_17]PJA36781.1 MAG: hypothetical protein CO183_01705 [Candidatus Zambryskibacteria bacterium CG_4_9_14_3_um_filter_42_9]
MEQKTNKQVEAFIFREDLKGAFLFLLMRRIPERGGFWQPLTGGVRVGEELENALVREVQEETGITSGIKKVVNTGYTFNFSDHGKNYTEYVYGVEVDSGTEVALSEEHDSHVWASKEEVLSLLKWPGNIEGFRRLCGVLEVK